MITLINALNGHFLHALAHVSQRQLDMHNTCTLVAAVAASSLATTLVLLAALLVRRRSVRADTANASAKTIDDSVDTDSLIREQLSRNYAFLGDERMHTLRNAFVVVVGCGGVGSHAAHMLVRSGISRIRLIDFDQVTLSSLNRHALATHADVGTSKVHCLARHFARIAPHAHVDPCLQMLNNENLSSLLNDQPDMVLDCIDNVPTKIALIVHCHTHNIPVCSSMGAAAKSDPSRIQIADISDTHEDPLARTTRRLLRHHNINQGVTVIYSTEKPRTDVGLLPLTSAQLSTTDISTPADFAILPDFRVRILPVLGTIPALFGCALATYTITTLTHWPIHPLPIKSRPGFYDRLHRELCNKQRTTYNSTTPIPFTTSDVGYLIEEIWRGRSPISGDVNKLVLGRWHPDKPTTLDNCILLTRSELVRHEKFALTNATTTTTTFIENDINTITPSWAVTAYGVDTIQRIESRIAEEQILRHWR